MRAEPIPCGPAVTESERQVLERVRAGLISLPGDDCWYVLTNLMFSVTHQLQSDEIDMVAIGPPGVRVVKVKHWTDAHAHWPRTRPTGSPARLARSAPRFASWRRTFPCGRRDAADAAGVQGQATDERRTCPRGSLSSAQGVAGGAVAARSEAAGNEARSLWRFGPASPCGSLPRFSPPRRRSGRRRSAPRAAPGPPPLP